MLSFHKHHELTAHHRYQLEVIFLFVAGLLAFITYHSILTYFAIDIERGQWYFFWPWMISYTTYSLIIRNRIPPSETISPLYRPIVHWVLLGLGLLAFHLQTSRMVSLPSVDIAFAIFTVFIADAYWDFKK
jgi:hypothetical protein